MKKQQLEKLFNKWIVKFVGVQDASIYSKGSQVRDVAISFAKSLQREIRYPEMKNPIDYKIGIDRRYIEGENHGIELVKELNK